MKILVINAGSSSLKFQLFDMKDRSVLAKGLCERIGIDGKFTYKTDKPVYNKADFAMANHADAIKIVISSLSDKEVGVISSMDEIGAVGHRVVHGGENFSASAFIDEKVLKAIEECIELAPLHNPPNLIGIRACAEIMGNVPQVAVFDTAFHQTMPASSYLYALPYEYYEKYKIRRYGFHGTSHKYVTQRAAAMLGKNVEDINIITCHLGNGSSITAVKNGKSFDTTMGFTPLEGLLMGTRCGNIDPAVVTFLEEKEGLTTAQINDVMNKKSGALGISGVSSDFRDLEVAEKEGNERAGLALEMFNYEVKKFIGSYAAALGRVDAIVFTAGIGENNAYLRSYVIGGLSFMGAAIDEEKNKIRGQEIDVSAPGATVRTLVIPTDEELMIALDSEEIVSKL